MINAIIKQLVDAEFNLFNVDLTKCPVMKNGAKMKDWINKSFEELVAQHNYHSNLWGMKLGNQKNGRYILSLDFDIFDKDTNGNCEETLKQLNDYLTHCKNENGIYTSSTQGNMNVLVDYTNSPIIKAFVEKLGTAKFTKNGLEILLKGNQVIPPSQTNCKKSKKLGNPRSFKIPTEPFYVIENEDCFTFQFITSLFEEKLKSLTKTTNKVEKKIVVDPKTDTESNSSEATSAFLDKIEDAVEKELSSTPSPNSEISKLLAVIGSTRCCDNTNSEWNKVAQVIKNETKDEGLLDFVNWTNKFGTENKKNEAINHYQKYVKYTPLKDKKRLTIGSLHYWAKLDNEAAYYLAFPKKNALTFIVGGNSNIKDIDNSHIEYINNHIFEASDYDYAVFFNKLYKDEYKCVDKKNKEYYCFNKTNNLWEQNICGTPIRNRISTDFYNVYEQYQITMIKNLESIDPENEDVVELIQKKIRKVAEMMIKLKKTGDKNNILCEISDICLDTVFPSTLNKSEFLLPTNDGKVLNMKDLNLHDRTINDKFSFQCGAKFIPLMKDDSFDKVDTYFNDLFCGNMETKQCVINILKSVFIGRPLRYIYFCIGNGNNGKSLLFKILNKIFGKFMDIISESVIIEQKGNKSALNTEIEKLDKCRLGYVTELKETDKLNEKVIKQISGGDAINLRTLHTKDCTINPTCNTFVLTNEMPSFNGEAKSMLKRMITIPFKGDFATNDDFEREMLELSDHIFSYIMHNGIILDKFDLSDEMIEEAGKHAKNNTETTLEDYLKEHLTDCVNDKKDNKLIVLNDLRVAFEAYCVTNKLKNSLTQKKFTSKMKTLGLSIKETNGKTMLCNKKFKDHELDDEE